MINVLVTSVGGGVGQSVVDSLALEPGRFNVMGVDISANNFGRFKCNKFAVSKRIDSPNYVDNLLQICAKEKINVLIPGNDNELVLLGESKSRFLDEGVEVIVSPPSLVATSRNKRRWYDELGDKIKIVPTHELNEYLECRQNFPDITFPAIVKPAAGSASAGVYVLFTYDDLLKVQNEIDDDSEYVIQPYLLPPEDDPDYDTLRQAIKKGRLLQLSEISVQFLFSKESKCVGVFASKNRLKNGVPIEIVPIEYNDLKDDLDAVTAELERLGVQGPVNLQGRLTEQGLVFFEMNLRFTGITGNRANFGFNEVASLIDGFCSNGYRDLRINYNKVGVRQVAATTLTASLNDRLSIVLLGASSWYCKSFVEILSRAEFSEKIDLYLVGRETQELAVEDSRNQSFRTLCALTLDDVNFTNVLSSADIVINFISARPPSGITAISEATLVQQKILASVDRCKVGLLINISSQSVYDQSSPELKVESDTLVYDTPYSMSKGVIENLVASVQGNNRSMVTVSLRLGRLWGAGGRRQELPYKLLEKAICGANVDISSPDNVINFIDVSDASRALLTVMRAYTEGRLESGAYTYNVGGHNVTVREFAASVLEFCEQRGVKAGELVVGPPSSRYFAGLQSKGIASLGWSPTMSLKDTWSSIFDQDFSGLDVHIKV